MLYGDLTSDEFPHVTDWYVEAHAACRDAGAADQIFEHFAGEERRTKFATRDADLGEYPQVGLTRTAPANPDPGVTGAILERLATQIGSLFASSYSDDLE